MFPNEQFFDKEILNSPEFQKWWEEGYHQVWKVNLSFKEYCALYHVKTEKTWEEVKKEQIRMTFKKFGFIMHQAAGRLHESHLGYYRGPQ